MENLIAPLISLTNSLYTSVAKRLNHFRKFSQRIQNMKSRLDELKHIRNDLQKEIEQAQLEGCMSTEQAQGWLKKVDQTVVEAHRMLEHPVEQAICSRKYSEYRLSKKADRKEREISQLIHTKANLTVLVRGSLHIHPIPCGPTVGMNDALEMAIETIADDEARIIGIFGTGGVGKTTLLKSIHNEYLSRTNEFEAVIWITVSKGFNLERIQRCVISRLGLSFDQTTPKRYLLQEYVSF